MESLFLRFHGTGNWGIMRTIKISTWIFALGILTTSCIERYFPESETNFIPKLVIAGSISADEGDQEVVISESSSSDMPVFSPVSGCTVFVEDEKGNRLPFYESAEAGHYRGKFEGSLVIVGSRYRLSVKTPSGKQMLSKYEKLMPCPVVDSVYYELQSKPTTDPEKRENGLQFYVDFKGNENYGNFFRWQLIETFEYHSTWPLDRWLDWDGVHDLTKPDYSNFICYKTDVLNDIFVLSTDGFSQNNFSKYKLHFVKDQIQKLQHKYSLLVRQYSLTKSAYNYWENIRKNNQESVDLFGRQPANVKGNIYNLNDTTDLALGYFSISTTRAKRIMISSVQGLKFDKVYRCKALVIDGPIPTDERPFYFAIDYDANGVRYVGRAGAECIFCTMLGGTTEKPPYWDK